MKHHLIYSYIIILNELEYHKQIAEYALFHHENWDGTGYPGNVDINTGKPIKKDKDGNAIPLKGEEIPIYGRVVAIADVYDALACRRIYKEAWSEDDIFSEMKRLSGTKFDPELIDIFFESIEHFRNISHRYPDNNQ